MASIKGKVTDASTGRPLVDTVVTASTPKGETTAITDATGEFAFFDLLPGPYKLHLEKEGHQVTDAAAYAGETVSLTMAPVAPPAPPEHIMQFFAYAHLPPLMQVISKPFCDLAQSLVESLPRNPERTVALRKLLEAKDAAVRAAIAK